MRVRPRLFAPCSSGDLAPIRCGSAPLDEHSLRATHACPRMEKWRLKLPAAKRRTASARAFAMVQQRTRTPCRAMNGLPVVAYPGSRSRFSCSRTWEPLRPSSGASRDAPEALVEPWAG